ncbi:LysM domain protein [Marvinbryantia formatexigens DSM 14469]|uniref:LysM domain protein n=2 Tax=Marvinbryantia TaxID=248744 RepID=C6LG65_9FIRM|nr:LysM domain protein [Marvinbryantia formatexigens DSM 14469]
MPESIKVKGDAKYQEYDIIRDGTYAFPSGADLQTVQWTGTFWGEARKDAAWLNRLWLDPADCINKIEQWRDGGTVLNLIVSGGNINKDVTIKSFEYEQSGGNGDYEYSIVFVVYRENKVTTIKEAASTDSTKKKTVPRKSEKKEKKRYTVKSGDTLWAIARKFYGGSGSDWKKIYDANKSTIESTAKKYGYGSSDSGHWIFPGCVLTIP